MKSKKYKIGYTSGVYDLFHIGHLNILKNAKEYCEKLIVAVSTDEVVLKNKNKKPIICYKDRAEIVKAIKYVDLVVPQERYDIDGKIMAVKELGVDVMFVGSDWKNTEKWNSLEKQLNEIGCDVIYLPHTDGISTSIIVETLSHKK